MEKEARSVIHTCSPIFDLSTPDIWRAFAATDFDVSEIYEKMYEAGIPVENQRVGSLLNFCATKNIGSVKVLEPDLYARINARFQNIEFMAQFSKSGYYKIGKPKDTMWNGRNHIKAGVPLEEVKKLSDEYEAVLVKYGIKYVRKGDEFEFEKKSDIAVVPVYPLKDVIEELEAEASSEDESVKQEIKYLKSLNHIHTTWKDYCLYMLNTTNEPIRSIWREKMITSIQSWKFGTGSVPDPTIDALEILSDLPSEFTLKVTDDAWEREDWKTFGRLPISGKHVLSIAKYPQESLEKEALDCVKEVVKNKDVELVKSVPKMRELFDLWNKQGGKSITALEAQKNFFGKEEKVEYPVVEPVPEEFSEKYWENALSGAEVWFKENIHSTSSWKRFCIAILKNDVTLKYLGFAPTATERLARARAIEAFSKQQEEVEKAQKEAKKLAQQIAKENEGAGVAY